ncbi:MAG: hypothetical protein HQL86_06095 [Magnetococcales bacterium]|nr:hypothetical protein [Magnetococcales bacterium]
MSNTDSKSQGRSLTEVLRKLTLERHLQLWTILLEEDPAFSRKLELLLAKEMAPGTPKPEPEKRPAVIDITPFRREAKAITASLRGRYGDGMGEMIYDRLQVLLTRIEPFLDADDGDSALLALREILDAFTYEWIEMDEEGDISILIDEMGEMIAQALLCADPPLPRRQEWLKALRKWHDEMADYGCEEGANVAIRAAEEGWDLPELNAILRGEFSDTDSDAAHPQDPLARIRMRILALRGRHEERLNLARFYGEFGECAQTLLHLGRADEAERIAMTRMTTPMEMQTLAQQFHDRGDVARALRIAERGLAQKDEKGQRLPGRLDLARWLRDHAVVAGNHALAMHAAEEAVVDDCEMGDYLALERLAGEMWPSIRTGVLERVVRDEASWRASDNRITLLLHEGWVHEAIRLADQYRYLDEAVLRAVMMAAMTTHPDWVIQRSRAAAEEIMNAARSSSYEVAAEWLALTREAHLKADRLVEWSVWLAELIQKHARKYKLKPLLEKLKVDPRS